jgi:hypothetical protein
MLALNDGTAPTPALGNTGASRRRVFTFPAVQSHSLIVMTETSIHLTPLTGEPNPELVKAIESGADLDELLDPLATSLELASVRKVKLDLIDNSLTVDFATPSHTPGWLEMRFATQKAADTCFTRLWRRLGAGYELLPYRRDAWSLVRVPVLMMMGVLTLTLVLAMIAHGYEEGAEARAGGMLVKQAPTFFETVFRWFPWEVICGIGGAMAAVLQVWIYRRLTEPPVKLVVARIS